jgi:hypothetical protein
MALMSQQGSRLAAIKGKAVRTVNGFTKKRFERNPGNTFLTPPT